MKIGRQEEVRNRVKRTSCIKRVEILMGYFVRQRTGIVVSTPPFNSGKRSREKAEVSPTFWRSNKCLVWMFWIQIEMLGWENSSIFLPMPTLVLYLFPFSHLNCFLFPPFSVVSSSPSQETRVWVGVYLAEKPETWSKFFIRLYFFRLFFSSLFFEYRL